MDYQVVHQLKMSCTAHLERIYNPDTAMGFLEMVAFQLDNTKM